MTAVSAPGKVFLAGGYLVLDRKHTGLIFGLDARIHSIVQPGGDCDVTVRSPQFQNAVWTYQLRNGTLQDASEHRNPFVKTALQYALSYNIATNKSNLKLPLDITILADNDYYSSSTSFDEKTARFRNFNKPITKVHKTGLGSSAALVTSLVGAVLSHSSILSTTTEEAQNRVVEPRSLERLHRLAQGAHCAAQGKIGSGFDVASAVFGSCLYRRFSPAILENLGSFEGEEFGRRLVEVVDSDTVWDYEINAFGKVKIPPGLRLVMCDVDCGSETPGMVKQVLKWRDENNVEADELWNELHTHNEGLARLMTSISEGSNVDYRRLTECFQDIRSCIRRMSEKAGVPIEPAEQTSLLDSCCNIPGVLGGVVPGAGGYDAITLLIHDDMEVISALERHLQSWKFEAGGGTVKLLGVRGEMEGFRLEDAASYRAWL